MARIQRSQYGRLWYSTFNCFVQATRPRFPRLHQLWLLCKLRENLSPFTKDFRAEELREYSTVFEPLLCKGDNRKQRWASSVLGWGGRRAQAAAENHGMALYARIRPATQHFDVPRAIQTDRATC